MTNPYLEKLRARDQEKCHPVASSKPSKPMLEVEDLGETTAVTFFEGFEGDRCSRFFGMTSSPGTRLLAASVTFSKFCDPAARTGSRSIGGNNAWRMGTGSSPNGADTPRCSTGRLVTCLALRQSRTTRTRVIGACPATTRPASFGSWRAARCWRSPRLPPGSNARAGQRPPTAKKTRWHPVRWAAAWTTLNDAAYTNAPAATQPARSRAT